MTLLESLRKKNKIKDAIIFKVLMHCKNWVSKCHEKLLQILIYLCQFCYKLEQMFRIDCNFLLNFYYLLCLIIFRDVCLSSTSSKCNFVHCTHIITSIWCHQVILSLSTIINTTLRSHIRIIVPKGDKQKKNGCRHF